MFAHLGPVIIIIILVSISMEGNCDRQELRIIDRPSSIFVMAYYLFIHSFERMAN